MLIIYSFQTLTDTDKVRLCTRNTDSDQSIQASVQQITQQVKQNGDQALFAYSKQWDKVNLQKITLEGEALYALADHVTREQKRALEIAFNNIHRFHQAQASREKKIETSPGVTCWREMRPIERVGLYIPGGSAVLPSTFLMLGVPARIAGCAEIVVCTPPQQDGLVNGFIAYCAQLLQIPKIHLVGGAQAIAAMAYGTESVAQVDKIFGPGNAYVTMAKQLIQTQTPTAIDMPAGPSEVLIIADAQSNPAFIAADLLAQAEHGADSQAILVTTDLQLIEAVQEELAVQIEALPRKAIAKKALRHSYSVHCNNLDEAFSFSNQYAPEHLILHLEEAELTTRRIKNAGSVFLGKWTPESMGDYASGTNHTLPTSGYARAYSGVSLDSFVKKLTFQQIQRSGLQQLGPTVETLAEIEALQAHKNAVSIRLKSLE